MLWSIRPGLGHRGLGILPAVVRALDAAVTDFAGRQGGSSVSTDIGLDAGREILVPPDDIILVPQTDASGMLAEGCRTGHSDPALHTYYTRLFFRRIEGNRPCGMMLLCETR